MKPQSADDVKKTDLHRYSTNDRHDRKRTTARNVRRRVRAELVEALDALLDVYDDDYYCGTRWDDYDP